MLKLVNSSIKLLRSQTVGIFKEKTRLHMKYMFLCVCIRISESIEFLLIYSLPILHKALRTVF